MDPVAKQPCAISGLMKVQEFAPRRHGVHGASLFLSDLRGAMNGICEGRDCECPELGKAVYSQGQPDG